MMFKLAQLGVKEGNGLQGNHPIKKMRTLKNEKGNNFERRKDKQKSTNTEYIDYQLTNQIKAQNDEIKSKRTKHYQSAHNERGYHYPTVNDLTIIE